MIAQIVWTRRRESKDMTGRIMRRTRTPTKRRNRYQILWKETSSTRHSSFQIVLYFLSLQYLVQGLINVPEHFVSTSWSDDSYYSIYLSVVVLLFVLLNFGYYLVISLLVYSREHRNGTSIDKVMLTLMECHQERQKPWFHESFVVCRQFCSAQTS